MKSVIPPNTVIEERYRVLRQRLGSGGMGEVRLALDNLTGRKVAVKFIHADHANRDNALARFQRESRIIATLRHENICDVRHVGVLQGQVPYLVMPLLRGETLSRRLKNGALDVGKAVEIALQVLSALHIVHGADIIHRDLKPSNVFLCPSNGPREVAKLMDFGISKMQGGSEERITKTGVALGTYPYMAPEQASGHRVIDHRADIYSAGAVLYEMVTGSKPVGSAVSIGKNRSMIIARPFPMPSVANERISRSLELVILRAMSRDPANRYTTASSMRVAIELAETRPASSPQKITSDITLDAIPLSPLYKEAYW
jgi:serine/threonine protein kinase